MNKERKKQHPKKKEEKKREMKREISKKEISGVHKNKLHEQSEKPKITLEISQTQSDVKSFLEKFKADVARKRKEYQKYARESQKRKRL